MSSKRSQWGKPQLIVLARGTPQESVLASCKTQNPNKPGVIGPTNFPTQDICAEEAPAQNCSPCQDRGVSDT